MAAAGAAGPARRRVRMKPWARNGLAAALVVAVSTALAVLLGELALRVALDPGEFLHASLVDDPVLGHRIEPGTTGHDRFGFRNRSVPEQVGIVAIGDSNTYGVSATRDGSWPHQLGAALGEPVYNMGLGGYGPLQYLELARTRAATLKPRLLVVGLYFGNDLMDAHYVARGREHWKDWRPAGAAPAGELPGSESPAEPPRKRFEALRNWLSRHSMLYGVLRATVLPRFAAQEREAAVRRMPPDSQWAWVDPAPGAVVRTVFTPQGRLAAVDPQRPPVREGLDITKQALVALHEEAGRQQVRLLVALIPTKERAYCRYLLRTGADLPPSHRRLCEAESVAKAELLAHLEQQQIARLDVTPALEAAIDRHEQLYPPDADGHAQAAGYGVIARTIAEVVRRDHPRP